MTVSSGFDPNGVFNLIGLWDFAHGAETRDTGLADGIAQDGQFIGGASAAWGDARFDGSNDRFDVSGQDAPFDLSAGVIEIKFQQDAQIGHDPDTLVSRGEFCDRATEGYFGITVLPNGAIQVLHDANGKEGLLTSDAGLVCPGDEIKVTYSWDAATGGKLVVENLDTGATQTLEHSIAGLDMDVGDNDGQSFTFGAREADDGQFDQHFDGSIDYVAVYQNEPVAMGDGIVEGTAGDDLIDIAYLGDPEGDRIDNGDALLPGEAPDDDIVDAGAGDDTILAGAGDDTVYAGRGDDHVEGGAGNDLLYGDSSLPGGGGMPRESFEWDKAPDPNGPAPIDSGDDLSGGFTQNTGSVDVTYSVLYESPGVDSEFTNVDLNVDGVVTDGAPADDNSGLWSELNGEGHCATYQLEFSQQVTDVSFNINDIDGDGVVRIQAWDADGNQMELNLTGGSKLTLLDTDTLAGNDAADSQGGYGDPDTSPFTLNVSIAGPVARITIEHTQNGPGNTGIAVTDVYFTPTVIAPVDGNDTLIGGEGDDILYGEGGNDTLSGGAGKDVMEGGDDRDTFTDITAGDTVDGGAGFTQDPSDDFDTLDLTGSAGTGSLKVNITGPDSDGNGFDGTVEYFDAQGNHTGSMNFVNIETVVPCFTPGTMIATPRGERAVETLQVGDRVITRDNGIQRIRWVGKRVLGAAELVRSAHMQPVRIRKGALGNGLPERDMLVSPNHRVLVANDKTALYFEESEVLVAAKHLTGLEGVDFAGPGAVTYIHFMFDQHEVVLSDGVWTESFQPGDQTLSGLGNAQRNEIYELFPELKTSQGRAAYQAARRSLKRHEAQLLVH